MDWLRITSMQASCRGLRFALGRRAKGKTHPRALPSPRAYSSKSDYLGDPINLKRRQPGVAFELDVGAGREQCRAIGGIGDFGLPAAVAAADADVGRLHLRGGQLVAVL